MLELYSEVDVDLTRDLARKALNQSEPGIRATGEEFLRRLDDLGSGSP
jgi:hypothetical protein